MAVLMVMNVELEEKSTKIKFNRQEEVVKRFALRI